VLYALRMTTDYDFATTLATITAKAMARWRFLDADAAVAFAWYSVNTPGDSSIDDADLQRHFEMWLADVHETTLPSWMIGA
jgi:hypothetical protein